MLKKSAIFPIFILALVVRGFMLVLFYHQVPMPSSVMQYVDLSRNIVQGRGLGYDRALLEEYRANYLPAHNNTFLDLDEFLKTYTPPDEKPEPHTGRSPAYALLVALVFLVTGSVKIVGPRIVQLFLNATVCFMIYRIGTIFWSKRVGLIAAVLFACWFPQIFVSLLMLHDSVIAFFVGLSLLCFSYSLQERGFKWYLATGLAVGIGLNMRDTLLLLVYIFVGGWLVLDFSKKTILKCAAFGAVIYMSMLPWYLWNYTKHGQYVFLIPHQGISLMDGIADADYENRWGYRPAPGKGYSHEDIVLKRAGNGEAPRLHSAEYNQALLDEALSVIKRDPVWYAKSVIKRILQFTIVPWSLWQNLDADPSWITYKDQGGRFADYVKEYPGVVFWKVFGKAVEALIFILALGAFFFDWKQRKLLAIFLAIPLLTICSLSLLKAQPQYIVPMQVPYFILAGVTIDAWLARRKMRSLAPRGIEPRLQD